MNKNNELTYDEVVKTLSKVLPQADNYDLRILATSWMKMQEISSLLKESVNYILASIKQQQEDDGSDAMPSDDSLPETPNTMSANPRELADVLNDFIQNLGAFEFSAKENQTRTQTIIKNKTQLEENKKAVKEHINIIKQKQEKTRTDVMNAKLSKQAKLKR